MKLWYRTQGWERYFALCLRPWNVTKICGINKPWMNCLILFCSYFKFFLPEVPAWFALPKPPAGRLCALQLVGFAGCHSVFAVKRTSASSDLVNKNEVKPITFSTEQKYINVAPVIKLSLSSTHLRDLLLTHKLIRIVIHSALHLCVLVLIQLFQLSGFVNFYFSGCAPSHQEMSSGVRSESNALWFSLMPSINVSGNQAAKAWTLSLKYNSQYWSSCAFISIYSHVRHMCRQTSQWKCFFFPSFLIDLAVEMNESLGGVQIKGSDKEG